VVVMVMVMVALALASTIHVSVWSTIKKLTTMIVMTMMDIDMDNG
jgi:hypothetical protein